MVMKAIFMWIKQRFANSRSMTTSWHEICLGSVSKDSRKDELSEISLKGTVYDFWVDHSAVGKEDICNIHEYLINKNKIMFRLFKQDFIALLSFSRSLATKC